MTLQGADQGDATIRTLSEAGMAVAEQIATRSGPAVRREASSERQLYRRLGHRQGLPRRRGGRAGKELRGAQLHSEK